MQASHGKQTCVTSKLHFGKNNKFLSNVQNMAKLKHYRKLYASQTVKILGLSKQNARLRASKQKLTQKLGQNAKRGDVSAIVYNLNTAFENGLLHGKSKLLKFISNVSKNLNQKSPRYNKFTQQLYESLRIIGGPRTARFLASNLGGPSDDMQRRTKRKFQFNYYPDKPSTRVFEHIAKIYSSIKSNKMIKGDVLVQTAEDETVIIGKCEWDIHRDEGWEWCGKERDDHVCDPTFVHNVGSDDNAYARLVDAFNQNRVAGFARVIMLNPIHKDLPPFVILLQAVCNKFDHMMVRNQWSSINELYNQYLLDVLGPLVGHALLGVANYTSKTQIQFKVFDTALTMKILHSLGD